MALTGNWDSLRQLLAELRSVPGLIAPITRAAEGEVGDQFEADFRNQTDPWGNSWAPTKTGKSPVLNESGALANPDISSSTGVIRVRPEEYWIFHQIGANGMAERAVLPFGHSNWSPPIEDVIDDVMVDHFRSAESL